MLIDIDKIEVGERLRSRLDPTKLRQLADDMERNGQLQEIVTVIKWGVNSRGTTVAEKAVLVAGYRRLEAAKLLGWTQIRCTGQLGGEIDPESEIDILRAEYSENELRENFTEMERVAFGVKIKEYIASAARDRMLAGKKSDFEYDPETGYKIWNDDESETSENPPPNLGEGRKTEIPYDSGEVGDYIAHKIGMGREKFRQGEYVLKHGTEEQRADIDSGKSSITGVYSELNPQPVKTEAVPLREERAAQTSETFEVTPSEETAPPNPVHTKTENATAMLLPEEREMAEQNTTFAAMSAEEKVSELQAQLEAAKNRAEAAESEAERLRRAIYHRDGIISSLESRLEAAHTKIREMEEREHESDKHTP